MYSVRLSVVFLFSLSLLGMTPQLALAQPTSRPPSQCGTKSLSPQARRVLDAQATTALRLKQATQTRRAAGAANTAINYIPLRPHIGRKADGTGGYSLASLNNVMALTNKYFLQSGSGIQFYFAGTTPDYIDDDALYAQYSYSAFDSYDVNNALNQYYVHNVYGGVANLTSPESSPAAKTNGHN